jgi:hypothetical protein
MGQFLLRLFRLQKPRSGRGCAEIPIGVCDRCGAKHWNQVAEAMIEEVGGRLSSRARNKLPGDVTDVSRGYAAGPLLRIISQPRHAHRDQTAWLGM